MTKVFIEKAVLLTAKVKDELTKQGDEWVKTGHKKMELEILMDVKGNELTTGVVKKITSNKGCLFDVDKVLGKLKRFDVLDIICVLVEYKDSVDYRFYSIQIDGVDITADCMLEAPIDESLPF